MSVEGDGYSAEKDVSAEEEGGNGTGRGTGSGSEACAAASDDMETEEINGGWDEGRARRADVDDICATPAAPCDTPVWAALAAPTGDAASMCMCSGSASGSGGYCNLW